MDSIVRTQRKRTAASPRRTFTRRAALASIAAGAAVLTAAAAPALAAGSADEGGLALAFIPQESPEKLLGDIDAITTYLTDEIGIPVSGFVTTDHAAAIEALRNGDADISFMGALPVVIAEREIDAVPILAEVYRGRSNYTSRVFVRRDSGIETLADLKDRSIAFADPISESGYLYPADMFYAAGLVEEGAELDTFFSDVFFAGGYQQSMQALANGLVDAAGSSEYADLLLSPGQRAEVTFVAESDPIPSHAVIARPGLEKKVREGFVRAMLKLNQPNHRYLLKYVYSPDGYERADPATFIPVRQLAERRGVM